VFVSPTASYSLRISVSPSTALDLLMAMLGMKTIVDKDEE
jgi:hypothetical protein